MGSGVRKRLKVRWMVEDGGGEEAHAFKIGTGGTLEDYALCGLKLGKMHRWKMGDRSNHASQCESCKRSMGRSFRP